jgi:hypothetical protein
MRNRRMRRLERQRVLGQDEAPENKERTKKKTTKRPRKPKKG